MSRPTFLVPVLEELAGRAVASSTNPDDPTGAVKSPEWYGARARGVTASEVHKLRVGGARARRELLAAKRAGGVGPDLSNVAAVRWGQVREEFIAEWIDRRFGIGPNQTLFHGVNRRHLATPDGVGVDFDETLLLHEIKTSKHDLDPSGSHFGATGYYDQIQWQLSVTGARRLLFVWEQHDDDWSRWPEEGPRPVGAEPRFQWFERDEERIAELVAVADAFLAELDAAVDGPEPMLDPLLDQMGAEVLRYRAEEAQAKKDRERAWAILQRIAGERGDFSQTGESRVTWSAPVTTEVEEGDDLAACATEEGGRLFAAYADARVAWDEYRAKFTKKVPKTTPGRLTVTAPKKGGE